MSLDFECFRQDELVPSRSNAQPWFTVLMVDGDQQGHTSIKVTSDLRPILNRDNQKKPAIIVETGTSRREALAFQNSISNENGRQVRGIRSRGGNADAVATEMGYRGWLDSRLVFGVDETEAVRIPYTPAAQQ